MLLLFMIKKINDSLTPMEVLAHEAGHNSAKSFVHSGSEDGDYEYWQVGLQSNINENIYPTIDNTMGIINDSENRMYMKIIK